MDSLTKPYWSAWHQRRAEQAQQRAAHYAARIASEGISLAALARSEGVTRERISQVLRRHGYTATDVRTATCPYCATPLTPRGPSTAGRLYSCQQPECRAAAERARRAARIARREA